MRDIVPVTGNAANAICDGDNVYNVHPTQFNPTTAEQAENGRQTLCQQSAVLYQEREVGDCGIPHRYCDCSCLAGLWVLASYDFLSTGDDFDCAHERTRNNGWWRQYAGWKRERTGEMDVHR
jgi:hypothetical protein